MKRSKWKTPPVLRAVSASVSLPLASVVAMLVLLAATSRTESQNANQPSPSPSPSPQTFVERNEGLPAVPWSLLSDPSSEFSRISRIRSTTSSRERVEQFEALYKDPTLPSRLRGLAAFAAGAHELNRSRDPQALVHLGHDSIESTVLYGYALFYRARILAPDRPEEALAMLDRLGRVGGGLAVDDEARLLQARLLSAAERWEEAQLLLTTVTSSSDAKHRGDALEAIASIYVELGRAEEAVRALETLYYELPEHARAPQAAQRLIALRKKLPSEVTDKRKLYEMALARADRLLDEGHGRDAEAAYISILRTYSDVADTELVRLRLAHSQYSRRRLTASAGNFSRVEREDLEPEALYYRSEVSRRLRRKTEYRARAAELLTRFPESVWAEHALFRLGQFHDSEEEPSVALDYYRQLVSSFPHGERLVEARWRLAFDKFRRGEFEAAGLELEETARQRPGVDEYPRLLYWAGRSYEEAGELDRAEDLFRRVLLGYQNTYYGRRAFEHLSQMKGQRSSLAAIEKARRDIDLSDALRVDRSEIAMRIAALYAVGLPARALEEAELAAASSHRDAPAFRAMAAWIHSAENRNLEAIITIRDAFPFHVSATGDLLPRPIWELFYPLPYKEHVARYARERGLDPHIVAALIRQESTFNPRVRSRAGARGLMQIIPSTGRALARRERRRYQLRDLYNPEINIRYGTRYLRDVIDRFQGRLDYALAGYNAGPHRVRRWTGMDMSIDPEVFIEEIPFDETRGYVKLVLRNEMVYRRLYDISTSLAADE
jgi:soluble lytic murein transglycosylase